MLQIDHVYEFFSKTIFKDSLLLTLPNGVFPNNVNDIDRIHVFNDPDTEYQFFFNDQEPFIDKFSSTLIDKLKESCYKNNPMLLTKLAVKQNLIDFNSLRDNKAISQEIFKLHAGNQIIKLCIVTSEYSDLIDQEIKNKNFYKLYYFFHGFAALDWFRGYYALNYNKTLTRSYKHDFITYNRIVTDDRSYRIHLVSKLAELKLLDYGQVSFGVTDYVADWRDEVSDPNTKLSEHARRHAEYYLPNINKLIIDKPELPGSASADIPREVDALWNIVTETVFYYDKLHLTEKIFKPIVSKQPFMLLAAPGNLAYLRSYGFKTFDGIIDESYDSIQDNDQRVDAVVKQLQWYCNLSPEEKQRIIERLAPIVEYNFQHFYGEFKHIITKELLDNCKTLFKEIGYDDQTVAYDNIYKVLTN